MGNKPSSRPSNNETMQQEAEIDRLREICRQTHVGAKKGRYYYMTDFEPYDSWFEDVPKCEKCQEIDEAARKLRQLEDDDIAQRWKQRGGGLLHTCSNLRDLTPEYRMFLAEIGAERYDGCGRQQTNSSGKADMSRYIGSPNQPDPHIVDPNMATREPGSSKYWWEDTGDPMAWTPDDERGEKLNAQMVESVAKFELEVEVSSKAKDTAEEEALIAELQSL